VGGLNEVKIVRFFFWGVKEGCVFDYGLEIQRRKWQWRYRSIFISQVTVLIGERRWVGLDRFGVERDERAG